MSGPGGAERPDELVALKRRLERERRARTEAESIAERVTGELYSTLNDVKRLNSELEHMNDVLEGANQSMKEFVAVASHDMRGPLTAILGYGDILSSRWETLGDDRKREFLTTIGQQGRRLLRLVEDLLTVSRIEAGAVEAHVRELFISAELEKSVEDVGDAASLVRVFAPPELRVVADPDHLQRILVNYVTNAVKYGEPPIEAKAGEDHEWVDVRVCDQGDGVPPEFVPRLFGKFARADTENTRKQTGTGLGLSIVRGLARANGGDAWYEPNEPKGSVFAVRLRKASA